MSPFRARVPNLTLTPLRHSSRRDNMQPILQSCCGLDVHKSMVMACIAQGPLDKIPIFEIREFSTITNDLRNLSEWLKEYNITHIAMESICHYCKGRSVYFVPQSGNRFGLNTIKAVLMRGLLKKEPLGEIETVYTKIKLFRYVFKSTKYEPGSKWILSSSHPSY